MRLALRWLRWPPVLAFAACAVAIAALALALWPRQRITQANFDRIQVGMFQAELLELLGPPEFDKLELGLVLDSDNYAVNHFYPEEHLRRQGYQEYRWQQWTSSEICIVVVSDLQEGQAVCRYSGEGRRQDWLSYLRSLIS